MSAAATPKEIYERQLRLAIAGDRDAQLEWYALDAVVEFPFAPPGVPGRFEGREQIRAMSVALDAVRPTTMRVVEDRSQLVVHETTDPDVIIAEIDATVDADGRESTMRQVHVVRFRDGKIVRVRDYHAGDSAELVTAALGPRSASAYSPPESRSAEQAP